ncbi:MAG TPA: hypothetical protein VKS01_06050 [Bryobacteraceae bacterium]|nr:hypothetical protein [Bryobacteraceae bacterium]
MKKHIREILDDLHRKRKNKDFVPPLPKSPPDAATVDLNPAQTPVVPNDLENQELSPDEAERVRQLDFQAQENEERETLE